MEKNEGETEGFFVLICQNNDKPGQPIGSSIRNKGEMHGSQVWDRNQSKGSIIVQVPLNPQEKTPGPQYFPGIKPEVKSPPQYTMAPARREEKNILLNQVSTPLNIGPGN